MRRRTFLGAACGAIAGLLAGPATSRAEQGRPARQFYLVRMGNQYQQQSLSPDTANRLGTEGALFGGPYQTQANVCAAARPLINQGQQVVLFEECVGSGNSGGGNTGSVGDAPSAEQQFRRNAAASIAGAVAGTAAGVALASLVGVGAAAAGRAAGSALGNVLGGTRGDEPGFLRGLWNRLSRGISSTAGEMTQAAPDVYRDPSILWDATKNATSEIGSLLKSGAVLGLSAGQAAVDVLTDPRSLVDKLGGAERIERGLRALVGGAAKLAADAAQAAKDVYHDPRIMTDTFAGMERTVGKGLNAVRDTVTDPNKAYDAIKSFTGAENFENAMDPNRSLPSRLGQIGLGVFTLFGAAEGGKALLEGGTALVGRLAATEGGGELAAARLAETGTGEAAATRSLAEGTDAAKASNTAAGGATGESERIAAARDRLKNQPRRSPEDAQNYADYLKERANKQAKNEMGEHSTIRPGSQGDFVPAAEDVTPDTRGYRRSSQAHLQSVADKYGVEIYTRPTNSEARRLLDGGQALPKPELIKNKSITKLDTYLGAEDGEIGKVGHFQPKLPEKGAVPAKVDYQKLTERYNQRAQEFKDQSAYLAKHSDEVHIEGRLIINNEKGLPYTGDVDGFAIRGRHGETLPEAVVKRVENELNNGAADIMHGVHTEWNYSSYDRTDFLKRGVTAIGDKYGLKIEAHAAEDGKLMFTITKPDGTPVLDHVARQVEREMAAIPKNKFEISKGIDQKIRGSHAEFVVTKEGLKPGEALVRYAPSQPPVSGLDAAVPDNGAFLPAKPTASHWTGGTNNPLIKK